MLVAKLRQKAFTAGAVLGLTVALAACSSSKSSGSSGSSSSSPTSTSSSASSTPSPTPTTTPPTTPATTPVLPVGGPCTDANLSVSYGPGPGQGPNGGIAAVIVFTNTSSVACQLTGYPGVDVVDNAGKTLASATRSLRGPLGGLPAGATSPPVVEIQPGGKAIADIEGGSKAASCTSKSVTLRVAIPNTAVAHLLPDTWSSCQVGLFVHPIMRVAG